jgi:small conductance mechanosensitive channel
VNKFGDSGIDIKILGQTKPIKQWEVTGELRRRLKKAFDEEGIEIPWPHVKLYFGQGEQGKMPDLPGKE